LNTKQWCQEQRAKEQALTYSTLRRQPNNPRTSSLDTQSTQIEIIPKSRCETSMKTQPDVPFHVFQKPNEALIQPEKPQKEPDYIHLQAGSSTSETPTHKTEIIYKTMHGHGERYANYKSSNLWTNQNHQSPGTYPGKIGTSGSGHNITGSHYSTPNQAKGPSLILNEYTKSPYKASPVYRSSPKSYTSPLHTSDQLDDQNLRSHYSSYTPQPPSIKTSYYHTTQIGSSKSMDWRNSRKSTPFKPSPFHDSAIDNESRISSTHYHTLDTKQYSLKTVQDIKYRTLQQNNLF